MDTLDSILEELGIDLIDFMVIQLNGAEIEALDSIEGKVTRIRVESLA